VRDLVVFFRQLSVLISANVPIVQALRVLGGQVSSAILERTIVAMAEDIDGGAKLSQAMARYPHIFSNLERSLIQTGETSGKLDEVLEYLAGQKERDYDLSKKIHGAMIYPAIVITLMVVISGVMIVFVIPKLTDLLQQSGVELPLTTRIFLKTSNFIIGWWWIIILAVAGMIVGSRAFISTPYGRWYWDSWKLRVPFFGKLLQRVYLVRFCLSLRTLLVGGVTITKGLSIVSDVVGNVIYRQIIEATIKEVEEGNSISTVLAQSPYVPGMVPQMMAIGEQTGKLDEILEKISIFYSREIDNVVQNISSFIEPVVIIIISVGVGVLFAAVIQPIYQLSSGSF
jgi:type IV pilus assembly protein PilC